METKKLPMVILEHVYEKKLRDFIRRRKWGTLIPGNPTEDGEQPKKDIPGYDFVKTVVDKDGNTQHIHKKTVTPTPMPDPTRHSEPATAYSTNPAATATPETTNHNLPHTTKNRQKELTILVVPETKRRKQRDIHKNPTAQSQNTGTKESSKHRWSCNLLAL